MDRARLLVDRLVQSHTLEQRVQCAARKRRAGRKAHRVDLFHQVAEYGSLAAARRLGALRGLRFEVLQPVPCRHRDRIDVPVDLHRDDVLDPLEQPLVAQVTYRERLGRRAERHDGEQLVLVDIERQRVLAGDRGLARRSVLVDGAHLEGRRPCSVGQDRTVRCVRSIQAEDRAEGARKVPLSRRERG